eukprot:SAG11_NODE_11004_length_790_cov_1.062229_2_plen_181_part_01
MPLHLAMINGSDLETVEELLKLYPQAAERMPNGDYPLHVCLQTGQNGDDVAIVVIRANPKAVSSKGSKGDLPLHEALLKRDREQLIFEMVEAFPDSLHQKSHHGVYPLQIAMCNPESSLKTILRRRHEERYQRELRRFGHRDVERRFAADAKSVLPSHGVHCYVGLMKCELGMICKDCKLG